MAVIHKKSVASKQLGRGKPRTTVAKTVDIKAKANFVGNLRKQLKLNQAVFARLVPVSVRSLATLESGQPPTEGVARRLTELQRLTNALSEVIRKDSLGKWLQTPNSAFEGLKPLEIIDRGESDRIWSMIYFLRSGVPS